MEIRNVLVYGRDFLFHPGSVRVEGGTICSVTLAERQGGSGINESKPAREIKKDRNHVNHEIIDGEGAYLIPGLIDLHFHGAVGADVCDASEEALAAIAEYELSVGVTSLCPATMTLPVSDLNHILANIAAYAKKQKKESDPFSRRRESAENPTCAEKRYRPQASYVGVNMEGPFISRAKKGAQDGSKIIPFSMEVLEGFLSASEGLVKFIGIAPEENRDQLDFIREVKNRVAVSLAHTNADYDTAKRAFDLGASHAVHLYNAMPAYSHRAPGVVGAVCDSPWVGAELISDGVHIHPSAVRATFRMMGEERMILISDSMRATGMPDGTYTLGGLEVVKEGKYARLASDGALAGSVSNLADCMRTAVGEMGLSLETAVRAATFNPAREMGLADQIGSIGPGMRADLLLMDRDLNLKAVYKDGVRC